MYIKGYSFSLVFHSLAEIGLMASNCLQMDGGPFKSGLSWNFMDQ